MEVSVVYSKVWKASCYTYNGDDFFLDEGR